MTTSPISYQQGIQQDTQFINEKKSPSTILRIVIPILSIIGILSFFIGVIGAYSCGFSLFMYGISKNITLVPPNGLYMMIYGYGISFISLYACNKLEQKFPPNF